MLRRCTGSGGLLITGLHLLHRDIDGLRLGCVLAHLSEIGGKTIIKQEFRISRFKCEHPKRLWRDNLAADRFVEESAHCIKYRVASIVEIVLQLDLRDDHLLYRDPCADSSDYGDGERLQRFDPQRQHRLRSLDHGQLVDYFCCAFEGGARLGEVAGLSCFKEPTEHATRVGGRRVGYPHAFNARPSPPQSSTQLLRRLPPADRSSRPRRATKQHPTRLACPALRGNRYGAPCSEADGTSVASPCFDRDSAAPKCSIKPASIFASTIQ